MLPLMRNARYTAALVLATMLLGGCALPRSGMGTNGNPTDVLIQASLIELDRQTMPEEVDPFCDPSDPSPPATCPPNKDEKPR
jgi:hypothetical protein